MPQNSIITYETLYETLRKEKYNKELQEIDQNFFQNTLNYLKEKTNILKSQQRKDSVFAKVEIEKTKKQLENIKKILTELYERRERKLIELALFSSRTNTKIEEKNILNEEKQFLEELTSLLNLYKENILLNILSKKQPILQKIKEKPKEIKTKNNNSQKLVRFLQPVPKFLTSDLNIYGPFENEDLALIPKKEAQILIKKNRAEEIKDENPKNS